MATATSAWTLLVPVAASSGLAYIAQAEAQRTVLQSDFSTVGAGDAVGIRNVEIERDSDGRMTFFAPQPIVPHLLAVAGTGAFTELEAKAAGRSIDLDQPGLPILQDCIAATVGVSWFSDNVPAGDWTLTLWRRLDSGDFSPVATFDFATS